MLNFIVYSILFYFNVLFFNFILLIIIVSLVFNIFGFLISLLLSTSKAARYGAISGYGAAVVKLAIIMGPATPFPIWLYVIMIILGVYCFFKGISSYVKAKRRVLELSRSQTSVISV